MLTIPILFMAVFLSALSILARHQILLLVSTILYSGITMWIIQTQMDLLMPALTLAIGLSGLGVGMITRAERMAVNSAEAALLSPKTR